MSRLSGTVIPPDRHRNDIAAGSCSRQVGVGAVTVVGEPSALRQHRGRLDGDLEVAGGHVVVSVAGVDRHVVVLSGLDGDSLRGEGHSHLS